ncbi:MAG TPA: hypothetical protein VGL94_12185 [Ktedonobacteraceae bacterium]
MNTCLESLPELEAQRSFMEEYNGEMEKGRTWFVDINTQLKGKLKNKWQTVKEEQSKFDMLGHLQTTILNGLDSPVARWACEEVFKIECQIGEKKFQDLALQNMNNREQEGLKCLDSAVACLAFLKACQQVDGGSMQPPVQDFSVGASSANPLDLDSQSFGNIPSQSGIPLLGTGDFQISVPEGVDSSLGQIPGFSGLSDDLADLQILFPNQDGQAQQINWPTDFSALGAAFSSENMQFSGQADSSLGTDIRQFDDLRVDVSFATLRNELEKGDKPGKEMKRGRKYVSRWREMTIHMMGLQNTVEKQYVQGQIDKI